MYQPNVDQSKLTLVEREFNKKVELFSRKVHERDPQAKVTISHEPCIYPEENISALDTVITVVSRGTVSKYGCYITKDGKIGGAVYVR